MNERANIYDPSYVKGLFDRMSKTYGFANYVTSFGFTEVWRRQCVKALPYISPDSHGYDFMSGMGEAWESILKMLNSDGRLTGVDISDSMVSKSLEHKERLKVENVDVLKKNILNNDLTSESADFIISTFGIKTFDSEQTEKLAEVIAGVLKPGAAFSLIEISRPKGWIFSWLYMFYLRVVIPFIGSVFLGNPHDYSMLGEYCARFGDCTELSYSLEKKGLKVKFRKYFFGCATGVSGSKPLLKQYV